MAPKAQLSVLLLAPQVILVHGLLVAQQLDDMLISLYLLLVADFSIVFQQVRRVGPDFIALLREFAQPLVHTQVELVPQHDGVV